MAVMMFRGHALEGEVLRAGGSIVEKFEKGTVGHAQFAYTTKRTKADREAAVAVLTGLREVKRVAGDIGTIVEYGDGHVECVKVAA